MAHHPDCTKAIIAVAGFGTRRLPITKAIEKCMLPIGDRPIIDYIVDDCIAAGITDIFFVVSEQAAQIRNFYGQNVQLQHYLEQHDKIGELHALQKLSTKAKFHFITQDSTQPYGSSTPLWLARHVVEPGESFLYLYGDNVYHCNDGSSTVAAFLKQAAKTTHTAALLAVEVPHSHVNRYGIIATKQQGNVEVYERIVEKPPINKAPSNLNNGGCFLLTSNILPYVAKSIQHAPQQEKYFTDAINWYAQAGNAVAVIRAKGEYLDCGSVDGWLYANNRIIGNFI